MSTQVYEQELYKDVWTKEDLIKELEVALDHARDSGPAISFTFGGLEIDADLIEGTISVVA